MATPNSIIITKQTNGNVLVESEGGTYTLLSEAYLTKDLDSVMVRGIIPSINYDFKFIEVEKVVREDGTIVLISDVDTLFSELNEFFFFVSSDSPSGVFALIQNVITVDPVNGDDSTAVKYDTTKPYKTHSAADAVAISGDLIDYLPGTITEQITLKDGVFYWARLGVVIDSPTSCIYYNSGTLGITSRFMGYAVLKSSSTSTAFPPIRLIGNANNIVIRAYSCERTASAASGSNKDVVIDLQNRIAACDYDIEFIEDIKQPTGATAHSLNTKPSVTQENPWKISWGGKFDCFDPNHQPSATKTNIELTGDIYIRENGRGLLFNGTGSKGIVNGNIFNLNAHATPFDGVSALVNSGYEGSCLTVNGNLYSLNTPCVSPSGASDATAIAIVNGNCHSENVPPVYHGTATSGRVKIIHSIISDGAGNTSPELVKSLGTNGLSEIKIENSVLNKDDTNTPVGSVMSKNSLDKIHIIQSTINCGAGQTICEADSAPNGEFYFKGTDSNKALGTNASNVGCDLYENKVPLSF